MFRISASALDRFLTCPLSYKHHYIDKVITRQPMGDQMEAYVQFGSAIHKTLEYNYKQKITSRTDLSIDDCVDFYKKRYGGVLQKLPGASNIASGLLLNGEQMIVKYMLEIAPTIQPIAVEREFSIYLPSIDAEIHGIIDLITEDFHVIDHKTAGETTWTKRTQAHIDDSTQFTMYSLAFRKHYGRPETDIGIDVLKRLKSGPAFNRMQTHRTDTDVVGLVQLIGQAKKIVEAGLFYPNLHSCQGCEFRNSCNRLSK